MPIVKISVYLQLENSEMMRRLAAILFLLMAFCGMASAISYLPVPCDSTSYYYCLEDFDAPVFFFDVHDVDDAPHEANVKTSKPLGLSNNLMYAQNPVYKKVKRDNIEYWSNIKRDVSSVVYMNRDLVSLDRWDSITMFLPLSTRNLNDFKVKSFGIRAKYVDYKLPVKQYFHVNLNRERIHEEYPWEAVFPLLLGVLLVLIAKFFMPGYIQELFLIVFYQNSFMSNVRERNVNADRAGALLVLNYYINIALFAMVALYRYHYVFGSGFILSFLTLLVLVVAVYFVKKVVSFACAALFGCEDVFRLHYKNLSYLMHCLGVVLLCANVGNLYINIQWAHDFVFWITVSGLAVAEFLKIFRLIRIIFEKHFPVFYLFLYLCAVEFLPVLVVIKMLSR